MGSARSVLKSSTADMRTVRSAWSGKSYHQPMRGRSKQVSESGAWGAPEDPKRTEDLLIRLEELEAQNERLRAFVQKVYEVDFGFLYYIEGKLGDELDEF